SEAVVKQSTSVLAEREHHPLVALSGRRLIRLDLRQAECLLTPATGEQDPPEADRLRAGHLRDLVSLLDRRSGSGQLALEAAQQREIVERQRQYRERAGIAGDLNIASG